MLTKHLNTLKETQLNEAIFKRNKNNKNQKRKRIKNRLVFLKKLSFLFFNLDPNMLFG